jgi:hypothetical protein
MENDVGSHGLIGTWRLDSSETRWGDGSVRHPWGPNPVGMLTYDEHGYMTVQLMRPDRPPRMPRPVAPDSVLGTIGELEVIGYLAYCGTYDVDDGERRIVHHVTCALLPELVGQDIVRTYELSGDTLTLRTAPVVVNGQERSSVLVWRRADGRRSGRPAP